MANLNELRTIVSTELGLYDDTSLALITVYLSINYQNIWNKYPWRDATGYGTAQVAAGIGAISYPSGMDRIITVRATVGPSESPPSEIPEEPDDPTVVPPGLTDSWFVDPIDSTFLIESEPRIYEERGPIKYYEELIHEGIRGIRLYPIPIRGTTLLFIGKMQFPGFAGDDTASALLRNIDLALIAYATADMLKRQRQYGKADLRRKEAQELEAVAWNLEQQQANQPRRTKTITHGGNSLGEMTDSVCTICGQWTPEYRQTIREFLRRNYQTLYDMFLWPESLVVVRVPYTTEQVVLPEYIDKVLGIRGTNNTRLFPADAGLFLDIAPSIFEETGDPIAYTTLTPVGVATLPAIASRLDIVSTNPADTGMMMLRGEVLSTGTQVEENLRLNGTTPVRSYWSYDIPITVSKDITLGFVTVSAVNDNYRQLVQLLPYQRESKHQRIWLLPSPTQSSSTFSDGGQSDSPDALRPTTYHLLVLGKRTIRPLLTDEDSPIITGAQQVLIAAAAADLFRKLEKHDMANAFQQKASGSTDVLKAKNTDQAASSPRFVPQIEPRAYVAGCSTW